MAGVNKKFFFIDLKTLWWLSLSFREIDSKNINAQKKKYSD
jgi:hypothetical protein